MFVARSKVTGVTYGPFDSEADFEAWHIKLIDVADDDDLARYRAIWEITEVTFTEDPHDVLPYDARFTFGPGSLEDMSLEVWQDFTVRVSGQFRVYCGNGNEHPFSVDSGFIDDAAWMAYIRDASKTHPDASPDDIREDVVSQIVEEVLAEKWSDPCEIEYGTEEESIAAAEAEIKATYVYDLDGNVVGARLGDVSLDKGITIIDDRTETEQDGLAQAILEDDVTPTCEICGKPDDGQGEDWNGETGNHFTCEADVKDLNRLRDETN